MTVPNLLRKMADNGFEYASRHNLLRTSQIHGEQEAKLLLDEAFSFDETHEQSTEQSQRMEIEESWQMIQGAMSFCFLIEHQSRPSNNFGLIPCDSLHIIFVTFQLA